MWTAWLQELVHYLKKKKKIIKKSVIAKLALLSGACAHMDPSAVGYERCWYVIKSEERLLQTAVSNNPDYLLISLINLARNKLSFHCDHIIKL